MKKLWIGTLAVLLAGCGGEKGAAGERGAAGEPCTVATTDGIPTITCPDGTRTTLEPPESCTIAAREEQGSWAIACGDEEPVVIREGERLPRSEIRGTVDLFGVGPADGAEVRLLGTDRTATTDETGAYAFDDVAPGIYRLEFSYPGYATAEASNVTAMGGTIEAGTQILRLGRLVAEDGFLVEVTPSGSHGLLVDPVTHQTTLVEFATGMRMDLGRQPGGAWFAESFVVMEDSLRGESTLVSVESGVSMKVPARWPEPMQAGVIVGEDDSLVYYTFPTAERRVLPGRFILEVQDGGGIALLGDGTGVALFDEATGSTTPFVVQEDWWGSLPPAGDRYVFHARDDAHNRMLMVLEAGAEEARQVHADTGPTWTYQWSVAGDVLVWHVDDRIIRWSVLDDTVQTLTLPERIDRAFISDSGAAVVVELPSGWTVVDFTQDSLTPLRAGGEPRFSENGRWVANADSTGISILDLVTGALTSSGRSSTQGYWRGSSYVTEGGGFGVLYAPTGTLTEVESARRLWFTEDGSAFTYLDDDTDFPVVVDAKTGVAKTLAVGQDADSLGFLWDADSLLVWRDHGTTIVGGLYLVDVPSGDLTHVDDQVAEFAMIGDRFFYVTADIDPFDGTLRQMAYYTLEAP